MARRLACFLTLGSVLIGAPASAQGPAPDFSLTSVDGQDVTLGQQRGRVVLVNFWATWCPPCRLEIPWLMQLQQTFGPAGFVVLGVSVDAEGAQTVVPWVRKERFPLDGSARAINYPILVGSRRVADSYGDIEAFPTSFLVDQKGAVIRRIDGPIDMKDMQRAIQKLMVRK